MLRTFVFILIFSGAVARFSAIAQTAQAAISGTVRDPDGRAVPEATIEVRQLQTGWTRRTQTGSAGTYSITELPIGSYLVSVSHPGFGRSQANVELLVGQERTLNFELLLAG